MKRFIFRLVLFISPLVIIAYPLDLILSYGLRQTHDYHGEIEVWNDVFESKIHCDIAVYGSSQAWVQIDPAILSDSLHKPGYNFGINGHNFRLQYLRHIELLKFNPKPKIIIYEADNFSLQKRADLYESAQFLPYMLNDSLIRVYTSSYSCFRQIDYWVPLIRYFGQHRAIRRAFFQFVLNSNINKYRKNGFRSMERKWTNELSEAKKTLHDYKIHFEPRTIRLFEQFIRECSEQQVKLILVIPPEYFEGQQFVSNRAEMIEKFREYSLVNKIPFLDYSNDSICFEKQLFYNSMHLNKSGAEKFSKKLASDLKQLLPRLGE